MSDELKSEVEAIEQDADVRRALKQAVPGEEDAGPVAKTRDKLLIGSHAFLLLVLSAFYYLLTQRFFGFAASDFPLIRKFTQAHVAQH